MLRREKMAAVDTAWLRMDRPTNLMMIVGVMVFKQRIDFQLSLIHISEPTRPY